MSLKTLKDFAETMLTNDGIYTNNYALRQAAREWMEELDRINIDSHRTLVINNMGYELTHDEIIQLREWIRYFFNLEGDEYE